MQEENNASCINSRAIIEYIRRRYPLRVGELFHNLPSPYAELKDRENFFSEENNWVPAHIITLLFENARKITGNENVGFEIGFEITLKAWMAGQPIVEIPTTWRDRVRGESRFNLRKWLPLYAKLWTRALTFGVSRHLRSAGSTPLGN